MSGEGSGKNKISVGFFLLLILCYWVLIAGCSFGAFMCFLAEEYLFTGLLISLVVFLDWVFSRLGYSRYGAPIEIKEVGTEELKDIET